jgi:hypothetical protein
MNRQDATGRGGFPQGRTPRRKRDGILFAPLAIGAKNLLLYRGRVL